MSMSKQTIFVDTIRYFIQLYYFLFLTETYKTLNLEKLGVSANDVSIFLSFQMIIFTTVLFAILYSMLFFAKNKSSAGKFRFINWPVVF